MILMSRIQTTVQAILRHDQYIMLPKTLCNYGVTLSVAVYKANYNSRSLCIRLQLLVF